MACPLHLLFVVVVKVRVSLSKSHGTSYLFAKPSIAKPSVAKLPSPDVVPKISHVKCLIFGPAKNRFNLAPSDLTTLLLLLPPGLGPIS